MLVFQPAEETAADAQAMIDDGLFRRFPKPAVVLGQHVMSLSTFPLDLNATTTESIELQLVEPSVTFGPFIGPKQQYRFDETSS